MTPLESLGTLEIKLHTKAAKIEEVVQREDWARWAQTPQEKLLMPDQHVKMKVPLAWYIKIPRKFLP